MEGVYSFEYCEMIYESSYGTMSLHKSKSGAYKAMREYILSSYSDWYNERIIYGKYGNGREKFGSYERWRIIKIEIYD